MDSIKLEPWDIKPEENPEEYLTYEATTTEAGDDSPRSNKVEEEIIEIFLNDDTDDSESELGLQDGETLAVDRVTIPQDLDAISYQHSTKRKSDIIPSVSTSKISRFESASTVECRSDSESYTSDSSESNSDSGESEEDSDSDGELIDDELNDSDEDADSSDPENPVYKCFVCVVCEQLFKDESLLNAHYKNEHAAFPCLFCDHKFPALLLRLRHYRDCHPVKSTNICNVCNIVFKNRDIFLHHCEQKHLIPWKRKMRDPDAVFEAELKNFSAASTCNFKLPNEVYEPLERAKTSDGVGNVDSRQPDFITCTVCGLIYCGDEGSRELHLSECQNPTKPPEMFPCQICKLKFSTANARLTHKYKVHGNIFKCDMCDRTFGNEGGRATHMTQIHGAPAKAALELLFKGIHSN